MKILFSCSKDKYGSGASLARALKNLNCEVVEFFDDEEYERSFPLLKNKYTHRLFWKILSSPVRGKFIRAIEKERPDLILVIKGYFYTPRLLNDIKSSFGVPLFCFNPDNPLDRNFHGVSNNWIRQSLAVYDAYFIWGKFLIPEIIKRGAPKAIYLPFAYDPDIHYPVPISEEELIKYASQIAFIGSWDVDREKFLEALLKYDLKIWGNGWHKASKEIQKKWQGRAVVGEEFSKVCAGSKIILDFLRPHMAKAHTMKIFEVAGCGGFLLSSCGGEFSDFFEPAKEFVCFSNPSEMLEKIDYFLSHKEERGVILGAAHERVKNHPYLKRGEVILSAYQELKN